jgi:Protein of unknown function (DUF541)
MKAMAAIIAVLAIPLACSSCTFNQPYRQQSTVDETVLVKVPPGFGRTLELASAISFAATAASQQKGIAGRVNVENPPAFMASPAPSASADPYESALRDAQTHAVEIAKLSGLPLGRITSVHQQSPMPQYAQQSRVILEVDYGPELSIIGESPFQPPQYGLPMRSGLTVMISGSGATAQDAQASAAAYEQAVRKAAAEFGLGADQVQVQGGAVNAAS